MSLLADRVLRSRALARGGRRAALDADRRGRAGHPHRASPTPTGFVVGRVVSAEQHPNADRLRVCEVETGDGRARRSSAARRTSPPARPSPSPCPGAVMPGGEKLEEGEAARDRVERDDPLASASWSSATSTKGSSELADGFEPGTPLAEVVPIADAVLGARTSTRTASTASASTGSPARFTRSPARRWRRRPGRTTPRRRARGRSRSSRRCGSRCPSSARASPPAPSPAIEIGPSPLWLKARLMARRAAADLQRRRHHQLRDAADRPAAARLRPRQGSRRRDDRPHGDARARG